MLHGLLHKPLIVTAALAAVALAAPGVGVARADDAQVTVVTAGGAQQALSLDALAGGEDIVDASYALRSATGESAQAVTGFSFGAVLAAADADPIGFSYLEVQRPAGGSVLLSRHQALDPGAFADGFPVVYATAGGTGFLRPSAGPEDLNAADSFEAPQGITLVLRKGSSLQVRAKASPTRTRPGQAVDFTAIVDRAGSGERLAYSWYFDDGHSAAGAKASHSFAKRGSYDVVVGVTTPGDEAGSSAVVTVQVGAPIGGPNRKGGGHNREADAPDHGAATGPGSGTPATPAASSTQAAPSPKASPAKRRDRRPEPPAPAGRQISGLLLGAGPKADTPPSPEPQAAARTGSLDGGGGGVPGVALGLLTTLGLLGAGALVEARGGFASLYGGRSPRGPLG